jgi:hypothetical protein
MNTFSDFLKPEVLFSAANPFLKSARQTHEAALEAMEKAAHLQLDFARDLLDINRKRFEAVYAGDSFLDTLSANQDFALEAGKRGLSLIDDAQAIASEIQEVVKESASEFFAAANSYAKPAKAAARKAKAA